MHSNSWPELKVGGTLQAALTAFLKLLKKLPQVAANFFPDQHASEAL